MLKYYYMIWSDLILSVRKNGNFTDKWKQLKYIVPICQGMNLLMFLILLKVLFNVNLTSLPEIYIFPGRKLNSAIVGITFFFLPFFIINYFLIFRNNRYEKILIEYKFHNGKLFFRYILLSLFIPILLLIIGKLFGKV